MILEDVLTCDLVDELKSREGVKAYMVEPHEGSYTLNIDNETTEGVTPVRLNDTGPATILVVID